MKRTGCLSRRVLIVALGFALSIVSAGSAGAAVSTGITTRVSVSSSAVQADGDSYTPRISADGRYVAFESTATNLVAGDTNGAYDVFIHDRTLNTTARVSVDSSGTEGNGDSSSPSISSDGRYVAFASAATSLVAGDTNGFPDYFVRDRELNTTTRVSVDSSGAQANGWGYELTISSDGRYVAFGSGASNLVAGDTNGVYDVFIRDRDLNTTTRVSVDSSGTEGNGDSYSPSVSSDGRYVAFGSAATSLVAGDTNGRDDVFLRDRVAGTTARVSVDSSGTQGNGDSYTGSVSGDGRYVAFTSVAINLVAGAPSAAQQVFVHDRVTGATTRVSVDSSGAVGNGISDRPSISADGRYVAFASRASNLVGDDTNGVGDVFIHDRVTGATTRSSLGSSGVQGNNHSQDPSISADGRCVAFQSPASNLVAGDTNALWDVFVHEAASATSITIKTNATTARIGNVPILSGAVTPIGMIGKNIVVYVKKPGKTYWSYSSNRTVYLLSGKAAWQYKYYFKPGMVKGVYTYKAVVPAWPGFLTSTSPTTVTIRLR